MSYTLPVAKRAIIGAVLAGSRAIGFRHKSGKMPKRTSNRGTPTSLLGYPGNTAHSREKLNGRNPGKLKNRCRRCEMDTERDTATAEEYRKKAREMEEQAASAQDEEAIRIFRELALQYELLARHNERQ
jgi:hypothetical protein